MAHHQLIRDLICEVRALRRKLESAQADADRIYENYETALQRAKRNERYANEQARELEQARYNAEMYSDYMEKAARERQRGNDWKAQSLERSAKLYR